MSNKNILTPVDFSFNSVQAFDFAVILNTEKTL